jgi:predicted lipoprotein with Yx(FWY)xxD motif
MKTIRLTLTAAALIASAAFAFAAGVPVKTVDSAKGKVLAGDNGMTLYTFKKDTKGVSNCEGTCLANWPALTAAADAKGEGAYSVITRKDGSKQWAKDGMPLYFWVKDTKAGDVTGDGVGGNWDVAKP